mgnify:CR=1 FL=1
MHTFGLPCRIEEISIVSVDNFFDKKFLNHKVNYVSGLMQDESATLLKDFFRARL